MMSGGKRAGLPSNTAVCSNLESTMPAEQDNLFNTVAQINELSLTENNGSSALCFLFFS